MNWNDYISDLSLTVSHHERQFILGTLLGTSSLIWPNKGKNAYLKMRESKSRGGKWLMCKSGELKKFSRFRPFVEDKDSYHWVSKANPIWNEFYDMCYKNKKKTVTMDWLNILSDIGWAVWYIDKGYKINNLAFIKTHSFGEKGTKLISRYFNELEYSCEGKKGLICFTEKGSDKYFRLILPCFPKYLLDIPSHIPKQE